jgi:hypothetical protein
MPMRLWQDVYIEAPYPWESGPITRTVTAGYDEKIEKFLSKSTKDHTGWRNPTGYDVEYRTMRSPRGVRTRYDYDSYWRVWWPKRYHGCFGDGGLPVSSVTLLSESLRHRTEVKALLKLKDQKVNLAQAFAERQKTVDLAYSAASAANKMFQGLRNPLNSLRKWDDMLTHVTPRQALKKGNRATKQLANRYLEGVYGLAPTLSDVKGSAEALAEADMGNPRRYSGVVKAREELQSGAEIFNFSYMGPAVSVTKRKAKCQVRLDFYVENPLLITASSLGLTNPLQLGWELLPFSFVYDWIQPVGSWLSTFDASLGYQLRGGSLSLFDECSQSFTCQAGSMNANLRWDGYAAGRWRNVRMRRHVYTAFPSTWHKLPGFKNPISTTHFWNAMALGRSFFK